MADHAVGELRLEPGGFRRHDGPGVGDRHEVAHLRRVERERSRHLAGGDEPLEFGKAAAAADEVDALVGARIGDAEERLDDGPGEQRDRQPGDRTGVVRLAWLGAVGGTELEASGPPSAATCPAAALTPADRGEAASLEVNSSAAWLSAIAPMTAGPSVKPKSRSRLVDALAMPA